MQGQASMCRQQVYGAFSRLAISISIDHAIKPTSYNPIDYNKIIGVGSVKELYNILTQGS